MTIPNLSRVPIYPLQTVATRTRQICHGYEIDNLRPRVLIPADQSLAQFLQCGADLAFRLSNQWSYWGQGRESNQFLWLIWAELSGHTRPQPQPERKYRYTIKDTDYIKFGGRSTMAKHDLWPAMPRPLSDRILTPWQMIEIVNISSEQISLTSRRIL